MFLTVPFALSAVYFGLEAWRFVKGGKLVSRKPVHAVKPISKGGVAKQNYMFVIVPNVSVFSASPWLCWISAMERLGLSMFVLTAIIF
jgi:hypothetical protein